MKSLYFRGSGGVSQAIRGCLNARVVPFSAHAAFNGFKWGVLRIYACASKHDYGMALPTMCAFAGRRKSPNRPSLPGMISRRFLNAGVSPIDDFPSNCQSMKDTSQDVSVQSPWARPVDAVLEHFGVDPSAGLTDEEAERRRRRHGPNRLETAERRSIWAIALAQFENLIVLLLALAAGLSFVFGHWLEGVSIVIAILINVTFGFFTEWKAVRSMEALREISRVRTRVRRFSEVRLVKSDEIVPGDIVILEQGDVVTADLRLLESDNLQVDESTLTGESDAVAKSSEPVEAETTLAERINMAFNGTAVSGGSAVGVVTATGMNTELGRIAAMAEEAEEQRTPLEKRLQRLGYRLIWLTLAIGAVLVLSGLATGIDMYRIIETSIALSVAAIPEGLPIVATIALARGMWRMLQHNALINRLAAVETLGTTTVICTDKTGTLTENRMTLQEIRISHERFPKIAVAHDPDIRFRCGDDAVEPEELPALKAVLEIGVLCNGADLGENGGGDSGDPLEIALLKAGKQAGFGRDSLLESFPEVRVVPFDRDTSMMASYHRDNGAIRLTVKGAPEAVLNNCIRIQGETDISELDADGRRYWQQQSESLAERGYRVLAMAERRVNQPDAEPYRELTFVGLTGLLDPPRTAVRSAVEECHRAGIRIVMVTGDHAATARNVGIEIGMVESDASAVEGDAITADAQLDDGERQKLLQTPIFARVTPKQKLDLIRLHQENQAIVAMTGDGVNDAPALRKADIGIAMGRRGTQVAREAADMVLKDDAFDTIVTAVAQGRIIFENIRKFILFLLSGNVGEILIVALAIVVGLPLPLLPLQILYLNLIGDVFPALALGVGGGHGSLMDRPPRDPRDPVLTRGHWIAIGSYGLLIAGVVLAVFVFVLQAMDMEPDRAVTVSFLTLSFARLWHVFNMRDKRSKIFDNVITRNPYVWWALGLCTALLVAADYLPGISLVLKLTPLGVLEWGLVLGASLAPLLVGQAAKQVLALKPERGQAE